MVKVIQTNNVKAPPFGVLSLEIARRIDDSDRVAALSAANYRYSAGIRELERQFETKAAALRQTYLNEVAAAHGEIATS